MDEIATNSCLEMDNELVNDGSCMQLNGSSSLSNEHVINGLNDEVAETVPDNVEVAGPSKRQAPNYDDIFPALPGSGPVAPLFTAPVGINQTRPKIRSTRVSNMYRVMPEDLRYRGHGRKNDEYLSRICTEIMSKTGADIQLTHGRDGTLSFLISGKQETTNQARKMLVNEFQAQNVHSVSIPKEHHKLILGKLGKKLMDLEQMTETKIQIPKQDENSDVIRITGTRDNIDKAVREIQLISQEANSRSMQKINVPKIYHPFIVGPFGQTLDEIQKAKNVKIIVPGPSVKKDEIVIIGEVKNVKEAYDMIKDIHEQKAKRCQTVQINVKKAQHKYVVGPKGATLNEIMQLTGVSIEMPSTDSADENIVLRGEPEKLANALAVVYQKAHSETEEEMEVPGWIHRHILGPKGTKFQQLSQEFPKVNVSFETEENRIKLSGSVEDIHKAIDLLNQRAQEIARQFSVEQINIADPKHAKALVAKRLTLKQIREDTKATIQVVTSDDTKNSTQYIRIEGVNEAVAKAKRQLQALLEKLENEVTYELLIERRFYGQIIGLKGEKIREIRNKFNNQVTITFPEQNDNSEKVIIHGAKQDAEQCYKYLSKLNQELLVNNYRCEVPILKQLLQFQGKDSLKKIREDLGVRLEVQNDDDLIVISGPQDKVEKAHERIQTMQNNLSDMTQADIIIPHKIHYYILGPKGRNIINIMNECGDVIITFPQEGSKSDRVIIRGQKEAVLKAKQILIEMSTNNYSEELKVRVEHHRYLIGKNGSNITKLREENKVRIQFPDLNGSDVDSDSVVITGKKEDVQKARLILEAKIKELDNISELEMHVDPKYHHIFLVKKAAVCKQLFEEYGGVNVSFPQLSDKNNSRIVLKGPKECLEPVKKRILEIVADFEAQETIEVEIDAQYHRQLLAPRNNKTIHSLQQEYDVKIKFPARPNRSDQNNESENVEPIDTSKANIVTITGRIENCEKAKKELLAMVPISVEISIPYEFHRFIIGQKGAEVRDLMDKHNVNIRVPPSTEKSDIIVVTGTSTCVESARQALQEKLTRLEREKADREARSFQINFQVDPAYHSKIIGKRGAVISTIRSKFDVQIQVPEPNKGNNQQPLDVITIIGYEENANKAKEHILKLVQEFKDLITEEVTIDSRMHSRLIGTKGKNIRRIMDQFKVDIRFPKTQNGENPDTVTLIGLKENVEECKEHLLELAENYFDVEAQYQPPVERQFQINFDDLPSAAVKESNKGFVVRGGPWEKKHKDQTAQESGHSLDMSNAQDFPAFCLKDVSMATNNETENLPINGTLTESTKEPVIWGPKRN